MMNNGTSSKPSPKVRVAVVGGGQIAPLHTKFIVPSPNIELVAIIDPFPSGQQLATTLSVPHFADVKALIAATPTPPDAYIVSVPSGLHVKVAMEILQTTTPAAMLVEKPLSTDSLSGQQLLDLAATKGCRIIVGHHRRFDPRIDTARTAMRAGRLGALTALSGVWTCRKNDTYYREAPWRNSRRAGGGPVWTNLVHDVDIVQYLVQSRVCRVWAINTLRRRQHAGVNEGDVVEEGAVVMLQFANGVVGSFVISDNVSSPFGWESAARNYETYAAAAVPVDCYRFFGTEGTLTVPDNVLWTYEKSEADRRGLEVGWHVPMKREVLEVDEGIPFQRQAEHLARLVRGEEEPVCPGEDGLATVKVCEAIVQALDGKSGAPIDI